MSNMKYFYIFPKGYIYFSLLKKFSYLDPLKKKGNFQKFLHFYISTNYINLAKLYKPKSLQLHFCN